MAGMDPFRHHPELRDRIKPAHLSYFRDLDYAEIDRHVAETGRTSDWRQTDEAREAGRRAFLATRPAGPLWVFAYGSLMWDPAMDFVEIRRAHSADHARRFCLWDDGARGSPEHPGLMLALDRGAGCTGLAFRIAEDAVEHETFVVFKREMIATAYRPVWMAIETDHGPITALGFEANHDHEDIRPDIPEAMQAEMIAVAEGFLGTNRAYLSDTRSQLVAMGIHDPYIETLAASVAGLGGE